MAPRGPESEEGQTSTVPEFRWGRKRGTGQRGKNITFYESFYYGGTEISRYDCVTVYKEGEPEPYIAKVTKIWEDLGDSRRPKKVKLHWFFRPVEIRNFIDMSSTLPKELFLASGTGKGVYNINPLEVIIDKCIVLCTSRDEQNPQPSQEDLDNADYFYYRIFDVDHLCASQDFNNLEDSVKFNKQSWVDQVRSSVKKVETAASSERDAQSESLQEDAVEVHRKEENIKEASKKIVKSDTSQREAKSQLKSDQFEKRIDVNVRRGSGSFHVPSNEQQKDETRSKVTVGECGKDSVALDDATTELTKDEKLKRMAIKENSKTSGHADGVNAQAKSSKRELPHEEMRVRKKAKPNADTDNENEMSTMTPGKMDYTAKSKFDISVRHEANAAKKRIPDGIAKPAEKQPNIQQTDLNTPTKSGRELIEITRRPEMESSKWFKALPWDEQLRKGYEQKAVIQLHNFNPSYTSSEIEDIMWNVFNERCTAKILPQNAFSNPTSGTALVVFKTKDAAEIAWSKLNSACLMIQGERPLIATKAVPVTSGKSKFAGHIGIEKHKLQLVRAHQTEDMKKAVATSHCSQPNTIEYEMAMEWRLLQEKSERWWKELFTKANLEIEEAQQELEGEKKKKTDIQKLKKSNTEIEKKSQTETTLKAKRKPAT
eukprot:TRINITY_DN2649_c0_g1_i1.p1 TRINITY_DN2649_c0_g1~~TRINITY_DN2649_c0_g1_i1.p1  ORF type:complete len:657 (+),score=169.45 TRINITY_DN2649_c0_g1_i1:430-2400(+)